MKKIFTNFAFLLLLLIAVPLKAQYTPFSGTPNVSVNPTITIDAGVLAASTDYEFFVIETVPFTVAHGNGFTSNPDGSAIIPVGTTLSYNTVYSWGIWPDGELDPTGNFGLALFFPQQFKTGFAAINLSTPSNGSKVGRNPNLTFTPATAAANAEYTLAITGPTPSSNSAVSSPFSAGPLLYGTYSWNVTIDDINIAPINNAPLSSATWNFEVVPSLMAPLNTLTGVSVQPKLSWVDDGTSSYDIEIATDNLFTNIVATKSVPTEGVDGATISYQFTEFDLGMPLVNNTIYYWRVSVGASQSATWSFRTTADVTINLAYPGNAAFVTQYDPLMFTWVLLNATGSLKYSLQVYKKSSAPTQLEWATAVDNNINGTPDPLVTYYQFDNLDEFFRTVNGLEGGTRYYWRIVTYYDQGLTPSSFDWEDRVVKYSAVNYFNTEGGAIMAYPAYPVNGMTAYVAQPMYYFYTLQFDPGATFEIIVANSNVVDVNGQLEPLNQVDVISTGTDLAGVSNINLTSNSTYYWQIRTTYGSVVTYSAVESFITDNWGAITAFDPYQAYPVDDADVYTTSPVLWWYTLGDWTNLDFEIEVRVFGGAPIVGSPFNAGNNLTLALANLDAGVSYEWRIRSLETGNPANFSAWTGWEKFNIVGGATSYTVAAYPLGNPTVFTTTPTLVWYVNGSLLGWSGYIVRWSDSPVADWSNPANYDGSETINDIEEVAYTFGTALDHGTTYYWAVALYDGVNPPAHADFSGGSFTIAGGTAVTVVNTTPPDFSVIYEPEVTLWWYLTGSPFGLTGYEIEYSPAANLSGSTIVPAGTVGVNNTYLISGLIPGATYYWRVRAQFGVSYSPWSPVLSFTVNPGSFSVVPRPGSPAGGVSLNVNSPKLSWFVPVQSTSSLTFEVQLANNANFTNSTNVSNLQEMQTLINNLPVGQYFWRVRSIAGNDVSNYSESASFLVNTPTSVEDTDVNTPDKFELSQNYPNPFNPSTIISYAIPENSVVTLKVYDILGNEVAVLVNDYKNAGRYTVNFDASSLSSGVYYYRISAGSFSNTKKMLLLK